MAIINTVAGVVLSGYGISFHNEDSIVGFQQVGDKLNLDAVSTYNNAPCFDLTREDVVDLRNYLDTALANWGD